MFQEDTLTYVTIAPGGKMEKEESEFGKGMVICLVKFAEHFMKLGTDIETYRRMREEKGVSGLGFMENQAVGLWAYGATDHLYDIEVPKGKDWDEIRKKVEELKDKGQNIRGIMRKEQATLAEAEEVMALTREIALMIDKKLGLKAELGQW